ncbi:glycosyltransferase family 39 protein [Flavobacterium sp.]|uniref:glycosyltransferase family 39 protein n=1 Tax=Flavobacterium sp. TaxID=239 RepID=UPI002616D3DE|nr:glycosyltransferase family 39 protein [Flavobacterium sp.]
MKQIKDHAVIIGVLLVAILLRFYKIDYQSVWIDEIHSLNEANPQRDLSQVYRAIVEGEQIPPLYFYSLYFLFKIFGYTTYVARAYSAIIGILSLLAIYKLGIAFFSKRVGYLAALIVAANPFHLSYSQEARPYMLLFLFTILALHMLLRFMKKPNVKSAAWLGFTAGIMISIHFFGLFVLAAFYFILLVSLFFKELKERWMVVRFGILSGIITLLLFLPAAPIFLKASEIKQFWIPVPTNDVVLLIFKEFFGNNNMLLNFIYLLFFFLFFCLAREFRRELQAGKSFKEVVKNKLVFSISMFMAIIVIVVAIPLVRSYLSVPMMVSRYFIVVIPLLALMLAIAIDLLKNKWAITVASMVFLALSLNHILNEDQYYSRIQKTQFRETTNFIKENNEKRDKIVSSLGWYLPFFLHNDSTYQEVQEMSLDNYVALVKKDTTSLKSFWYFDAFGREYKPNGETKEFLNKYFFVDKEFNGFDTWVKHFKAKNDLSESTKLVITISSKESAAANLKYTEQTADKRSQKRQVLLQIFASNQPQELAFPLAKADFNNDVSISFTQSKTDIIISKLQLSIDNFSYTFSGMQLSEIFKPNKYCTFDPKTNQLKIEMSETTRNMTVSASENLKRVIQNLQK